MMKRNDIVYEKEETGHWAPYGRIWKKAGPDHFVVIFLTKDVITYHRDQLVKVDYVTKSKAINQSIVVQRIRNHKDKICPQVDYK